MTTLQNFLPQRKLSYFPRFPRSTYQTGPPFTCPFVPSATLPLLSSSLMKTPSPTASSLSPINIHLKHHPLTCSSLFRCAITRTTAPRDRSGIAPLSLKEISRSPLPETLSLLNSFTKDRQHDLLARVCFCCNGKGPHYSSHSQRLLSKHQC